MRKMCVAFFLFAFLLTACGIKVEQPYINNVDATAGEKESYWEYGLWFPVDYVAKEDAEPAPENGEEVALVQTLNPSIFTTLERANEWMEGNEGDIGSFSVSVPNATQKSVNGVARMVPSGVHITYSRYPDPVREDCPDILSGPVGDILTEEDWIVLSRVIFVPIKDKDLDGLFSQESNVMGMLDCRTTYVATTLIEDNLQDPTILSSPVVVSGVLIVYSLK